MVLIGLTLPALARVRGEANGVVSASRLRQVGTLLIGHTQSHGERMPEWWEPVYRATGDDLEKRPFGDRVLRGGWWSNSFTYFTRFDSPPPEAILRAPGFRNSYTTEVDGEVWPIFTAYHISHAFYAEPSFWDVETQRGEVQFRAQRLDGVRFPAQKGLMFQAGHYGVPGTPGLFNAWDVDGFPNPVLWADLSVSEIAREAILPAVANAYFWDMIPPPTKWEPGFPVHGTKGGIQGRDR